MHYIEILDCYACKLQLENTFQTFKLRQSSELHVSSSYIKKCESSQTVPEKKIKE